MIPRLLASVLACAPEPPDCPAPGELPAGEVAFVADGVPVTEAALEALVERVPRRERFAMERDGRDTEFVEHVALTQALWRRAREAGLPDDPEVARVLAMSQRELLANEYLRWEAERRLTDAELERRYAAMTVFDVPQLRVSAIRLADAAAAEGVRQRLAAGEPFAEVARAVSADPDTAAKGGDLGWLDRSLVERVFGPEVAAAPPGSLVGPVVAQDAPHLVRIEAARDRVPLEEVRAGLRAELLAEIAGEVAAEVRRTLVIERRAR